MTLKTNKSSPDPINILGFEEVGRKLGSRQPRPQLRAVVVRDSLLVVVDPGPEKYFNCENVFALYPKYFYKTCSGGENMNHKQCFDINN